MSQNTVDKLMMLQLLFIIYLIYLLNKYLYDKDTLHTSLCLTSRRLN